MELSSGSYLFCAGFLLGTKASGFIALLALLYLLLYKRLKQRITYCRTGYVKFPPDPSTVARVVVLILPALAMAAANLYLRGQLASGTAWYHWMPLVPGFILADFFCLMGRRSGFRRFHWLAALFLAGSIAFTQLPQGDKMDSLRLFLMSSGGILAATGGILLVRFRRQHPVRTEEECHVQE